LFYNVINQDKGNKKKEIMVVNKAKTFENNRFLASKSVVSISKAMQKASALKQAEKPNGIVGKLRC